MTTDPGFRTDAEQVPAAIQTIDTAALAKLREQLAHAIQSIDRLQKLVADSQSRTEKPRRRLGRLAGRVHLSMEDALAPLDDDELARWNG